jgi:3-deoxy-D-arabino-heptulosonate 7-phosphate (DAHP) synthase class II
MGKEKIKEKLSNFLNIKINEGLNFLFVTDPMHGNTF